MKTFHSSLRCVVLSTQRTYADLLSALGWQVSFIALQHDESQWAWGDLTRDGLLRKADVVVWDISTVALEPGAKSQELYLYYRSVGEYLEDLLNEKEARPSSWILLNSAALYERSSLPVSEDSPAGGHAISQVLLQIERLFHKAYVPKVRKVALRLGLLLHEQARWWRWVPSACKQLHERPPMATLLPHDYCKAMQFVVERTDISGIFNVASPSLDTWDAIHAYWKQHSTGSIGFLEQLSLWWHKEEVLRFRRWAFLSIDRIRKKGCALSEDDSWAQSA